MGMWEAFMFICGYVKKDKYGSAIKDELFEKEQVQRVVAADIANRHFPNKTVNYWDNFGAHKVMLYFTDGTKTEIVGEEAKAILEAE